MSVIGNCDWKNIIKGSTTGTEIVVDGWSPSRINEIKQALNYLGIEDIAEKPSSAQGGQKVIRVMGQDAITVKDSQNYVKNEANKDIASHTWKPINKEGDIGIEANVHSLPESDKTDLNHKLESCGVKGAQITNSSLQNGEQVIRVMGMDNVTPLSEILSRHNQQEPKSPDPPVIIH